MKRTPTREMLDDDNGTPEEITASLADLGFINRWFGGFSTSVSLLSRAIPPRYPQPVSILEVAAGGGDVIRAAATRLEKRGIRLTVVALDRSHRHLSYRSRPEKGDRVVGDAFALPFADNSFDLVSCGLFLHHLSPADVVRYVSEALRVSRAAALVNDLIRHPLHLGLVYAGMPLYRSRITRHDAPASVRQAYTLEEMKAMLRKTSAARVDLTRHYLFRMGVIAWKQI